MTRVTIIHGIGNDSPFMNVWCPGIWSPLPWRNVSSWWLSALPVWPRCDYRVMWPECDEPRLSCSSHQIHPAAAAHDIYSALVAPPSQCAGPGVHLLQLTMATMAYNRGPVAASAEWVDARWNYVTSTKELVTGISNIFMEIFSVSDQFRGTIGKEKYWSTVACCLMFAGLLGCVDVCREQWCSAVVSVPSALSSPLLCGWDSLVSQWISSVGADALPLSTLASHTAWNIRSAITIS